MTLGKEQNIDENINRFINSSTDISQLIEIKKLLLEEQKNSTEDKIKLQDIELKKEENRLKNKQIKFPHSILINPATTAIVAAFAGFLTSSLVALIQGNSNLQLEQLKFQSNLIAKATESADLEERKKSLQFYIDAGLIKDPYILGKLKTLISEDKIPQFTGSIQTYAQTCENIVVQGDDLSAICKTVNGDLKFTSLKDYKNCKGGIENINGSLQCSKQE